MTSTAVGIKSDALLMAWFKMCAFQPYFVSVTQPFFEKMLKRMYPSQRADAHGRHLHPLTPSSSLGPAGRTSSSTGPSASWPPERVRGKRFVVFALRLDRQYQQKIPRVC